VSLKSEIFSKTLMLSSGYYKSILSELKIWGMTQSFDFVLRNGNNF
jgi:hypothetical protein